MTRQCGRGLGRLGQFPSPSAPTLKVVGIQSVDQMVPTKPVKKMNDTLPLMKIENGAKGDV